MTGGLLILTSLLFGQADESKPADQANPLADQVRRLVRQLDDDELARRVEAEKQLISLGPHVLDHLPPITPRTSAEAKGRLTRIRKTLETEAAEAATRQSLVTLHGALSLADAVAQLEKQTGNKIVGFENRGGEVDLDFEKQPFWPVLDQILDQVGLDINQYGGYGDRLTLAARPDEQTPRYGHASYNSIFRFEGMRLGAMRDLKNPQVNSLRLTMQVMWEPRTQPISLEFPLSQIELKDETGQSLPVDETLGELHAEVQNDIPAVDIILPMSLPSRDVKKIASLKGKMTAMIPGRVETFRFDGVDTASRVEQQRAGVTVTFEQLRKNVELYEVRIGVRFDKAANALESHRGWIYRNAAYLVGADNERIEPATFETTWQEVDGIGMAYLFDLEKGPKGYSFVYKTPAAIVKMPFEYELKDIDLP